MENLYYFVTNMSTWTNMDPRQFLYHYFVTNGAFTTSFLIALVVALVGLLLFYGWIGMTSSRLSTLTTWAVTLVLVGLVTFALTQVSVVGSLSSQTGFFEDATQYAQQLRENEPDETLAQFEQQVSQIRDLMDKGCDVTWTLDLWNTAISLIIFFFISLGVKRMTKYAIAIPF